MEGESPPYRPGLPFEDKTLSYLTELGSDTSWIILPGMVIKGFRLDCEIGHGGMGTVWRATQLSTDRIVALKMILAGYNARSNYQMRFLSEAMSMSLVKHKHVVEVLEFGSAHGRPFLAMEFMPGGSLTERLRVERRLEPREAAELLAKICSGVQAAHDLNIIHRDLKSGNILFDIKKEPKVSDFGLAKQGGMGSKTTTHAVMGTPAYMAPEQAEGNSRFVGPQADIYSLGVILYECITGDLPFQSDNPIALLRSIVEKAPIPPPPNHSGDPAQS